MTVQKKMTSEADTRVDSRTKDSRDEILKSAMRLFSVRGFHETSMSEVARAARVSKALIFWHFKTKEELFLAVLNRLLEPYFIDFAEEAVALDEPMQIQSLVEAYLLFVRDNAASVRFFLAQLLHEPQPSADLTEQIHKLYEGYRTLLVDLIGRAQSKGLCRREFSPESAADLLLSMLNGSLIGFLFMGGAPVDVEGAVAMLKGWLFTDASKSDPEGGKAVA